MILGIPLAIWAGIAAFTFLFAAAITGIMIVKKKKPWIKQHKILAGLACLLAMIHLALAVMMFRFGIVI